MFSFVRRLYGPVVVETTIPAPPKEVFAVLSDPETYPDWLVGADRMRSVDPEFPEPGSEFHHSVGPGGPLTIDDKSESIAAEPNRHLALMVHAGPFHGRVDFRLAKIDKGTQITLSEQPTGHMAVFTPLLRPSLSGRNKRSLTKLCEFISEQGGDHAVGDVAAVLGD